MQKYIHYLLQDIETIILQRWRQCIPHYFQMGIPDPYLCPPEGWKEADLLQKTEPDSVSNFEETIAEMEKWLAGEEKYSMFSEFGLLPEQFPPQDRLSEQEVYGLVEVIRRLWAAFNFTAVVPNGVPARELYPILLERMLEACTVMDNGHIGIEFCDYEPERCPFGEEYCSCKQL